MDKFFIPLVGLFVRHPLCISVLLCLGASVLLCISVQYMLVRIWTFIQGSHKWHRDSLRKVYGILAAQMLVTCVVVCTCMMITPLSDFVCFVAVTYSAFLAWLRCLWMFVAWIMWRVALKEIRLGHPWDYSLLFLLTCIQSLKIAVCVVPLVGNAKALNVLLASALAIAGCLCLTWYTLVQGKHFTRGNRETVHDMNRCAWNYIITGKIMAFLAHCASLTSLLPMAVSHGLSLSARGHANLLFVALMVAACSSIVRDTLQLRIFNYDDYIYAAGQLYFDMTLLFLF